MKDKEIDLEEINNELKVYVNEATFISDMVLKKLLKLICKCFYVDLPIESYLRVNIEIKENGNIIMKDEEYPTSNTPNNILDIYDRYQNFKNEIEPILKRKEISFDKKRDKNDLISFIFTFCLTIFLVILVGYSIKNILLGNIYHGLWVLLVLVPLVTPKIKERYIGALRFIKKIFKR